MQYLDRAEKLKDYLRNKEKHGKKPDLRMRVNEEKDCVRGFKGRSSIWDTNALN